MFNTKGNKRSEKQHWRFDKQGQQMLLKFSSNVPFNEFWLDISNQLGNARLRVNPEANTIHQFIDGSGDPKEYLIQLITTTYKRSHCYHLRAPISIEIVFDVLGEIAHSLTMNSADDLYDIEFLEEVGFICSQQYCYFTVEQGSNQYQTPASNTTPDHTSILSMSTYKIKRNNRKL